MSIWDRFRRKPEPEPEAYEQYTRGPLQWYDGEKFPGGLGLSSDVEYDYYTLRKWSCRLFKENIYARGIIKRLVENEINTGLRPEASPEASLLGNPAKLLEWSEDVEIRFDMWARSPKVCDYYGESTFYQLQAQAGMESYISGDVLVVQRQHPTARAPQIQLIRGSDVDTPIPTPKSLPKGHKVFYGVELDTNKQVVAYWVRKTDTLMDFERVAAFDSTGRRLAWLHYGTEKRIDEVRGAPLLSLLIQSLKEIDRNRDSVQRKSSLSANLVMFVKKNSDKPGTKPLSGGATRREKITTNEGDPRAERHYNFINQIPGLIIEELQEGEEPTAFKGAEVSEEFSKFEAAIVRAVAWSLSIPPEILTLSFSSNYSASQAAINEFKMYLNMKREGIGYSFCHPIYTDWLLSMVLTRRISARGLLEAWRDPRKYETFAAWTVADWSGAIKPSTDINKQANGYVTLTERGWVTNARAARELTGTKFSRNVRALAQENSQLVEAARPMAEFLQKYGNAGEQALQKTSILMYTEEE